MIERIPSTTARPTEPAANADGPPGRRAVLRGAAVAGTGLTVGALLAACGADGSGAGGTGATGDAGGSTGAATSGSVPVADVPVGGGVVLADSSTVVTQPTEGDFHAFDAVCTHQGCQVTSVDEQGIHCPCHGSVFDATTGEVVQQPATASLAERTVTVEGDTVSFS